MWFLKARRSGRIPEWKLISETYLVFIILSVFSAYFGILAILVACMKELKISKQNREAIRQ